MTESVRLISRRSTLAMWQTNLVADLLREAHPGLEVDIVGVDTTGDKIRDKPLPKIGGKGLFTRELEDGLREGSVDIAVHSLKDLPTALPDGLVYGGSPRRAAPTDCLVTPNYATFAELPEGATIATGSVRRRAQLLAQNPTLQFTDLRGNIDTRLRKLAEHGWDAIVMATAALQRLERPELIAFELDPATFVPAPAQGAIGLEIRDDRDDLRELLAPINHDDTVAACTAERRVMRSLEGGCSVPVAAHCSKDDGIWTVRGWVAATDGSSPLLEERSGTDPLAIAGEVADALLAAGAAEILAR